LPRRDGVRARAEREACAERERFRGLQIAGCIDAVVERAELAQLLVARREHEGIRGLPASLREERSFRSAGSCVAIDGAARVEAPLERTLAAGELVVQVGGIGCERLGPQVAVAGGGRG